MAYLSGGADVLPHVEEFAEHAVGPHLGDLPEPPIDRQLRVGHSHVFLGTKEMRLMSDSKSALGDRLKLLLEMEPSPTPTTRLITSLPAPTSRDLN